MSGFTVKVTGNKEVANSLQKGAKNSIKEALKKLVLKVEALAKKSTVVDTGRLRSSITSQTQPASAIIGTSVEYGEFVEYGTAKMEARHMEGSSKVLGQGMMAYTEEKMSGEIKEFEEDVLKDVKGRF